MKSTPRATALLLLGIAAAGSAWAYRGHGHGHGFGHGHDHARVSIAIGAAWGPWFPPLSHHYVYGYAPRVVERIVTPVYIERAPPPPPASYWYYCAAAGAYYPYVNACPSGWQRVPQTLP